MFGLQGMCTMFYRFQNDVKKIDPAQVDPDSICTGYISAEQLEKTFEKLKFPKSYIDVGCLEKKYFRSKIEVYDDYTYVAMRIKQEVSTVGTSDCIAMYIRKNFLLVVDVFDQDNSTKEKYEDALSHFQPQNITLEKLIYSFLNSLIEGHSDELSDMEMQISKLEEYVLKDRAGKNFNLDLHRMKKEMLVLRNYYAQLIDIGETLQENENTLFPQQDLRYFKIFTDKADRLRDKVKLLGDSLVQLGDVYKSTLDQKTNDLTRLFTVLTGVFLPLTVIVGWYGMNFKYMPELNWKYGYLACIIFSVVILLLLIWLFRRKKWL